MGKRTKQAIVIGAVAATLATGVGVAVADDGLGFSDDQETFLNDVAKRLDVTPAELKAALKGAGDARIDAALADGKITKEQADAMKQRSTEGGLRFFGRGHHGGFGPGLGRHGGFRLGGFGPDGMSTLDAVTGYLGLTEEALRTELEGGKSLAEIAKAKGKSVEGLKDVLAAQTKKRLDAAVKAGALTQAQADAMQARLKEGLDALVEGSRGFGRHHFGFGRHIGSPPPEGVQPPASFAPVAPAAALA